MPAPPMALPRLLEAHISPFTRPRSSGRSTSTARASEATSCRETKQLWRKTIQARVSTSAERSSIRIIAISEVPMPSWARSNQGRRRPMERRVKRSITTPQTTLKDQGSVAIATILPDSSMPTPCSFT